MKDLNDIVYFAKIVEHGSLSAASESLGVAKSVLSKHLARLEAELDVCLVHRTTRKLQVTDIGMRYYQCCCVVLEEVSRANGVIDAALGTPRGVVRLTCPINFAQAILAPLLVDFMVDHPLVEIAMDITNSEVDLIAEGVDVVLRIAPDIRPSTLVMRSFLLRRHILVGSADYIEKHGAPSGPDDLRSAVGMGGLYGLGLGERHAWNLTSPDGETCVIPYTPRLVTQDVIVLKQALLAGCGIAEIPTICCHEELLDGSLVHILPDWTLPDIKLYAVFTSRTGLMPAVRCFIDYLSLHMDDALANARGTTMQFNMVPQRACNTSMRRHG